MTSDLVLVARAQAGDTRAANDLAGRYSDVARRLTLDFYCPGGDRDDLIQEALYGLVRAIRLYQPDRGVPFAAYAKFAMHRQLVTAVVAANRAKHVLLTESVRSLRVESGEVFRVVDLLEAKDGDPVGLLDRKEERANIVAALAGLTELERRSLLGVLNGLSYAEIELGEHRINHRSKQVENALIRARRKLAEAA